MHRIITDNFFSHTRTHTQISKMDRADDVFGGMGMGPDEADGASGIVISDYYWAYEGGDNGESFEEEMGDNIGARREVDDVAPGMPNEYYENVETFLSRAPPKIKIDKVKSKSKREIEQEIAHDIADNALPKLPQIQKKAKSDIPPRPNVSSKVAASLHAKAKSAGNKEIDADLLMQAFAYVNQLSRDQEDEPGERRYPNSAPEKITPEKIRDSGYQGKQGNAGQSGKKSGVVKRLRSKTQPKDNDQAFALSSAPLEEESKGPIDFDSLVANFEQGITLQKLRAELDSSKASIARSEDFMRQLAREYGGMPNGNTANKGKGKGSGNSGYSTKR
jgi:hypothetical protein